jgi:hypothetical protein
MVWISALYMPRCLPDGDFVVRSRHFMYPWHISWNVNDGGIGFVVVLNCCSSRFTMLVNSCLISPCNMSCTLGLHPFSPMYSIMSSFVKGVPWACLN